MFGHPPYSRNPKPGLLSTCLPNLHRAGSMPEMSPGTPFTHPGLSMDMTKDKWEFSPTVEKSVTNAPEVVAGAAVGQLMATTKYCCVVPPGTKSSRTKRPAEASYPGLHHMNERCVHQLPTDDTCALAPGPEKGPLPGYSPQGNPSPTGLLSPG